MESKYQIGDWVEVAATVKFAVDTEMRRRPVRTTLKSFEAQIVGAVWRQIGAYHSGFDGEGAYLERQGTVLVWLVRRGMTNRQVEVLPDDLTLLKHVGSSYLGPIDKERCLPWRWTNPFSWSDEDRKALSVEAEHFPRDSRGRFIK